MAWRRKLLLNKSNSIPFHSGRNIGADNMFTVKQFNMKMANFPSMVESIACVPWSPVNPYCCQWNMIANAASNTRNHSCLLIDDLRSMEQLDRNQCLKKIWMWSFVPGGRFKNTYELLNLRALKISIWYKNQIFQCMGKIICMEFQRIPLKFLTKYLTHTLKDDYFM